MVDLRAVLRENSVGIASLVAEVAVRCQGAICGPWGSVSSKELKGTSGTDVNVDEVIPALLMNVFPTRSIRYVFALQHHDQLRERFVAVADEVRRASQRDYSTAAYGTAIPTTEASGQPAGFASNCAAVQAFCSVVNRDGNSLREFDFDPRDVRFLRIARLRPLVGGTSFTCRLAPLALLVFPGVDAANPA